MFKVLELSIQENQELKTRTEWSMEITFVFPAREFSVN